MPLRRSARLQRPQLRRELCDVFGHSRRSESDEGDSTDPETCQIEQARAQCAALLDAAIQAKAASIQARVDYQDAKQERLATRKDRDDYDFPGHDYGPDHKYALVVSMRERAQQGYMLLVRNYADAKTTHRAARKLWSKSRDDRAVASYNLLKKYAEGDGALAKLLDLI